ncbi:putative entry exclusion protein TrbK-alt [Porphyrobacter sp. ULC335]|uniref:putative entry exclusion protein TrbK-alt n=1 Tax=Porphyrobacter sp. ULC335 TaxID=2854260 RepID=UPI00221EE6A2|nr:putative entry exclusion protein TrbK-alt [Porphyrobacter sp. ULC335]UYV16619.1 putative entry exclusion protein TrbK-alt [Porphyrobacter sp. ULC335]
MESKRPLQIGAAIFVGLALAMTLVQLREEPEAARRSPLPGAEAKVDPLAMQLRACSTLGEQELSSPACRAAWAEKRRRFFGATPSNAAGRRDENAAPSAGAPQPTASGSD